MVKITLATGTSRTPVIVNVTDKLGDIIAANNVDTSGATIMLKGNICSLSDQQRTLAELGLQDGDEAVLNVTVKASAAAVSVSFQEVDGAVPVLTIKTDITKDMVENGYTELVAKDEDGAQVYRVSKGEKASIDTFGLTGNAYVDGKLVAALVLSNGTKKEDAMKKYGDAVLAAATYIDQIVTDAASKQAKIEEAFGVTATTTEEN